jgi:rubredoxin
MDAKTHAQTDSHPDCPRCDSAKTQLVSESPVAGAWVVYNCLVCFYSWRSTEPDYATKSEHYNPNFKIRVEDIPTFAQVPSIPALRSRK